MRRRLGRRAEELRRAARGAAGEAEASTLADSGQQRERQADDVEVVGREDGAAVGDLDGDGTLDLYVANDRSENELLLNDGGTFTPSSNFTTDFPNNGLQLSDKITWSAAPPTSGWVAQGWWVGYILLDRLSANRTGILDQRFSISGFFIRLLDVLIHVAS